MRTYLAIDAGTTAVKAVLYDERCHALFAGETPVTVRRGEDGAAETDMESYWSAVCALTKRAAADCPDGWDALCRVCAAGQGDGLWPLDRQGRCFMPAILWQDTRAASVCGGEELLRLESEHHCNRLMAGSRGAILSWLRAHRPAAYEAIAYPLSCVSYIHHRLTGAAATDASNCGDCFDVLRGSYVPELYDALGVGDMTAKLMPVRPCDAPIGTVTSSASRQCGILAGVEVLNGCLDATAVVMGGHCLLAGTASVCVGTTLLVMCPQRETPRFPLPEGVYVDCVPYETPLYRLCFAPASGGSAIDAVKETYFPQLGYEALYEGMAKIPAGSEGLLYFPFLHGERSPFSCPKAQAVFCGAAARHTPWHRMRAAAEGVLFAARHCLDASGICFDAVDLTGGASRAPVFCQMAADVFGLPVRSEQGVYAGTEGCLAIMRGRGAETGASNDTPVQWYRPDARSRETENRAYGRYRELLANMLPQWQK